MADQLGLQSLTIPEEYGGSGFSYVELIVILEEMGSALLCAPYFSTVGLAANALLHSGDDSDKKDVLLEVESAKSAADYAGWAAAEDSDELPVVASLAKSYCSEAFFHAAAENIQIHGGIGFTWEHDAHLYFKRAKSSELLLGDPSYHRELLAQRIGI